MITLLTRQDMAKVFTMAEAIQADKDALALYSGGDTDIPLRANLRVPAYNGSALYMYGYAPGASALGVKIVSVYPDNPKRGLPSVPATMVLMDDSTGAVSSLLDGTYLTRVRTGAVAGAATDLLARRDSRVFALFGAGGQAEGQLEAVLTVRDIELAKVYCRTFEKAEAFAKAMSEKFAGRFNTKIVAARSPEEAIADADLLYVTHVHPLIPDADTRFPTIDPGIWQLVSLSGPYTDSGSGIRFEFAVYGRRSSPDRP